MIFRAPTYTFLAALLVTAVVLAWKLMIVTENDRHAYSEIATLSNLKSQEAPPPQSCKASQHRENVVKVLVTEKDQMRLIYKILSDFSYLTYCERQEGKELIEKMKNVLLLMQEEIYCQLPDGRKAHRQSNGSFLIDHSDPALPNSWVDLADAKIKPMQVVRSVLADEGIYSYHSNNLLADELQFKRFIAEGHGLDDLNAKTDLQVLLTGQAKHAEFSPSDKKEPFKMEHLKATMF